ncbi:MAG: c-type cytochrome [Sandaracinus sp.]|nr:c-type cytochrome [Sandaracinus sp.]
MRRGWLLLAALLGCSAPTEPTLEAHVPVLEANTSIAEVNRVTSLPVQGGHSLLVGDTLWVADPERDRVYVHDRLDFVPRVVAEVVLPEGSTPFRLAQVGDEVVASLRGVGEVARIDVESRTLLGTHEVCAAPRGVAADPSRDRVLVACAGGELVALSPEGEVLQRATLGPDLRDVVVDENDAIFVSVFLAAEIWEVDGSLEVIAKHDVPDQAAPPPMEIDEREVVDPRPRGPRLANTAWRMRAAVGGGVTVLHQLSAVSALAAVGEDPRSAPQDYGSGEDGRGFCGSPVVGTALTRLDAARTWNVRALSRGGFFVDFVEGPTGTSLASGDRGVFQVERAGVSLEGTVCEGPFVVSSMENKRAPSVEWYGEALLAAVRDDASVSVLERDPVSPVVHGRGPRVVAEVGDVGHALFHQTTEVQMACASCHAEGRDDGLVWNFGRGERRTQSLVGGVAALAPFHWKGDVSDMAEVMQQTFEGRMKGHALQRLEVESLEHWLDTLEVVAATADEAAVARGEAVFEAADCASCHSGSFGTNGLSRSVGGERWQVPMLRGVGLRAPFFHDGCASSLREAIDGCTDQEPHPGTAALSEVERDDLAAFLSAWD